MCQYRSVATVIGFFGLCELVLTDRERWRDGEEEEKERRRRTRPSNGLRHPI